MLYAAFYTALDHGDVKYFVSRLFRLPDHLWYLMMLTGMYLAYPVLRRIAADRAITRYMIWLLVAYGGA